MHIWTDTATIIGDLLTLATAAINLAAILQTRPGHSRNQQRHRDPGRQPTEPR